MKKFLGIFAAVLLCMMMVVAVSAAGTTVYVNDGGTGDGSSATSPMGSMTDAITKVANGGTVVITDTYTCADEFYEPAHSGDITISGGKYVFTNGKYNRWFLAGKGSTTFENITFEYGAGTNCLFVAQYNKIVFSTGVTTPATGVYLLGGFQVPFEDGVATGLDSDITVKSGSFHLIAGFNRGTGEVEFTGTSHITVEGGTVATVYGASVNGNYSGNAIINIKGGTINNLRTAGDATRRLNGDCTVNISGGTIGMLTLNNVMGKTTVNYTGGSIAQAEKSVEPALADLVKDGTATLNASANLNTKIISLSFDTTNYTGGGATTQATTAKTTAKTTEKTAEKTTATTKGDEPVETTAVGETTDVSTEPVETTDVSAVSPATEEVTEAVATTEASATTAASDVATTEGGSNTTLIIVIVVAVVVVIGVVVFVIVKKKKN